MEFGQTFLITRHTSSLFSSLLPFWVTRFAARGKKAQLKPAVFSPIYNRLVSIVNLFSSYIFDFQAIGTTRLLADLFHCRLVHFNFYMITVFESILQAIKPQAVGYGFIIQEIVKVIVALVLILGFKQIFLGAILGLVACLFRSNILLWYLLSDYFKEKVNWGYLKEWLKGSPAIAYNALALN